MEKQRRKAEVSKADKTNKGKEVLPVWKTRKSAIVSSLSGDFELFVCVESQIN